MTKQTDPAGQLHLFGQLDIWDCADDAPTCAACLANDRGGELLSHPHICGAPAAAPAPHVCELCIDNPNAHLCVTATCLAHRQKVWTGGDRTHWSHVNGRRCDGRHRFDRTEQHGRQVAAVCSCGHETSLWTMVKQAKAELAGHLAEQDTAAGLDPFRGIPGAQG